MNITCLFCNEVISNRITVNYCKYCDTKYFVPNLDFNYIKSFNVLFNKNILVHYELINWECTIESFPPNTNFF